MKYRDILAAKEKLNRLENEKKGLVLARNILCHYWNQLDKKINEIRDLNKIKNEQEKISEKDICDMETMAAKELKLWAAEIEPQIQEKISAKKQEIENLEV